MVSFGPLNIGNVEGLWALLALVPLILLYLTRPRPKMMPVPSLMFFLKSSGSRKLNSFLRQITRDWLFIIQLLLLLGAALSFAEPFTTYQHDVTASNTVIVLDASASMQTKEGSRTRFDLGVAQAKKVLGARNTIVLAKDIPFIALQEASNAEALKFLNGVSAKETPSKIGEAIILAGEALGEGRVVVISDFINTGGQDPEVAKQVLEAKGLVVDFINVLGEKRRNVGIIDMQAGADQTTVHVKNYNDRAESATLVVGSLRTPMKFPALGVETFSFKTPSGVTKISLEVNDDLAVDNEAFLSAPAGGKAKVLLIANNGSTFVKNALLASGELDVTVSEPPIIQQGDFDVIVVSSVDMNEVLPGTFEDVLKQVEKGATAVVAVQEDSDKINYRGLLPVKISGRGDGGFVVVEQLNRFTKNIDFGKTDFTFKTELVGDQTVIASVNDLPAITIKPVGVGKVVYFGIPDSAEFKYSPHYPIFWTELMKAVTDQQDVRNLNFKSGETLLLDEEQRIKTPSRTVTRAALLLDEQGIYELEDRKIAVNLLDEIESNINLEKRIGTRSADYKLHPVKETREFQWVVWLLSMAVFLSVFEVWFVKSRGDL